MSAPAHPTPVALTGDPDRLLPAATPETAPQTDSLSRLYGWEFSVFAKEMWTDDIGKTPWVEAVTLLRAGIRVGVWCTDTQGEPSRSTPLGLSRPIPAGQSTRAKHELLLHPDGTITMLDHPDYTVPDGGHSNHLHQDTELFLHAMGNRLPACVKATLWLVGEQHDPATNGHLVETFGFADGTPWRTNHRLRSLYAAVAWAQQPVWPAAAWGRYLSHGITPRVLSYWVSNGWTVAQALRFLNRDATFNVAEQWRLVGDTTHRAARMSGRGETPDSEIPWLEAGFAPGEADKWRFFKNWQGPSVLTPDVAWRWHQHRVMPNSVKDFEALPPTEEEALKRPLRAIGNRMARINPSLPRALEWSAAGVPSELVLAWYRTIGDDLDTTLAWCRKVPAMNYATFADWNTAHPETPLNAEQVALLHRTGMGYDAAVMAKVVAAGLTNDALLRPVNMLVGGKRWLGLELRAVFTAAITAAVTREGMPHATKWTRLAELVEADNWDRIVWDLRSMHMACPLWAVLVDWLSTHPTPPKYPHHTKPQPGPR